MLRPVRRTHRARHRGYTYSLLHLPPTRRIRSSTAQDTRPTFRVPPQQIRCNGISRRGGKQVTRCVGCMLIMSECLDRDSRTVPGLKRVSALAPEIADNTETQAPFGSLVLGSAVTGHEPSHAIRTPCIAARTSSQMNDCEKTTLRVFCPFFD
jgi:hypothetical protein